MCDDELVTSKTCSPSLGSAWYVPKLIHWSVGNDVDANNWKFFTCEEYFS